MRVSFPSIANAGAIDNIPISYSIYHGIEEETNNYTVAWQPGKLTIEPRRFTLTTASATKEYDDTPLVEHGVTISGDELAKGHVYHRYADTDPINAGKYENKTSIRIFDKSDVDVTDLGYEIQYPICPRYT